MFSNIFNETTELLAGALIDLKNCTVNYVPLMFNLFAFDDRVVS